MYLKLCWQTCLLYFNSLPGCDYQGATYFFAAPKVKQYEDLTGSIKKETSDCVFGNP